MTVCSVRLLWQIGEAIDRYLLWSIYVELEYSIYEVGDEEADEELEQETWKTKYEMYSEMKIDPYAQINAGYILANHLIDDEDHDNEAINFYKNANCVEADRNLFVLYLKREEIGLANEMAQKLLFEYDDGVTWDYISNCMFDMSWEDYSIKNKQDKKKFSFDVMEILEFEDIREEYRGYNPPSDTTNDSAWIPVGVETEVTQTTNHPYTIWHFFKRKYMKNITNYEKMYEE